MRRSLLNLTVVLAMGTAGTAMAQQRHGPPAEAIAACANLRADDTCSFSHHGRDLTGTCRTGPDGQGQLACAPKDMPGRDGHRGPPAEAFTACASLKAGDACTVTLGDKTIEGLCRTGPDGQGKLACAPKDMGGREGHRGPPAEALQACASLREGDTCSFAHHGRTIDGMCRKGPDGAAMACAPKDLPPRPPQE